MHNAGRVDRDIEGLGARLIIAAALNELRRDPEAFARRLVALAQVKQADATEIAGLLSGSFLAVSGVAGHCDLRTVTPPAARPADFAAEPLDGVRERAGHHRGTVPGPAA